MPYVYVTRDLNHVENRALDKLGTMLLDLVAAQLSTAAHPLTDDLVNVYFSDFGPKDISKNTLEVKIEAHRYPERLELDLDDRADVIKREIEGFLADPATGVAVWIQLVDGGYAG